MSWLLGSLFQKLFGASDSYLGGSSETELHQPPADALVVSLLLSGLLEHLQLLVQHACCKQRSHAFPLPWGSSHQQRLAHTVIVHKGKISSRHYLTPSNCVYTLSNMQKSSEDSKNAEPEVTADLCGQLLCYPGSEAELGWQRAVSLGLVESDEDSILLTDDELLQNSW